MKKGLANICFIAMCMLMLTLFVACNNGSTPPHEHTYNEDAWVTDDTHHWYAATCEHTEEVKAKAPHTWDEGKETTHPKPGVAGVKTFTCTICNATRTEPIPALPPQSGDIGFATGYKPGKTYDRDSISIDKSKIVRIVDGTQTPITNPDDISFMFKTSGADDSTYSNEAPTEPGSYTVKIIVEASTGWERKEQEEYFSIDKIVLEGNYTLTESFSYNGENQLADPIELTNADLSCILAGDTVIIKDIKTNKNAGTNPVDDYTIVANDYYDDKSPLNISATVNPFNISPDTPINISKVYDGTTNAEFAAWGATIPEADRSKLKLAVVTDGKDVGTHSPTNGLPVIFYLDGASTSNYTIDKSKISINITARPLSFNENPTAVYDGSNRKVVAGPEIINNIVDGESLTITIETGNQNVLSPDATPPTGLTYTISAGTNTISSNYQIKQSEIDRARIIPVELVLKDPNSDALTKFEYQNNKKLTKKVDVLFNGIVNGQDITLEVEFSGVNVHSSYKDHKFLIGYGSTTYNYKLSETDYQQLKTAKISPKTLLFFGKYYMATKGNSILYFMLPSQIQSIGLIKVKLNVPEEYAKWESGDYFVLSTSSGWSFTPEPKNENFTVKIQDSATIEVFPIQKPSPTVTVGGTGTEVTADANGRLYCKIEGAVKGEKYTIIVKDGTETVSYDKMTLRADGTFIVQYITPDTGIFEFNGDNDKVLQLHAELTENQTYTVKVAKVTKVI